MRKIYGDEEDYERGATLVPRHVPDGFNPPFAHPSLFDTPDVRTPAPSAPGSITSADAAEAITKGPFRSISLRKVMLCLASAGHPLSRQEIADRTGLPLQSVCGRVRDLEEWLETVPASRDSLLKPGLKCDGLQLNYKGWKRVKENVR